MGKNYLKNFLLLLIFTLFFSSFLSAQEITNKPEAAETEATSEEDSSKISEGSQKIVYTPKQESMRIKASDIRLVAEKGNQYGGGGFNLYIRKLPGVESVLLTETAKDPNGKQDSYAYRAKEYNSVNGDEIRYLNGKVLESEGSKYSLVSSTVVRLKNFGEAFHIYIPKVIVYGYDWTRHGEIEIGKGTFINIRTFEKKYADYSGEFMDSSFMFDLVTRKKTETVTLTDDYNPLANDKLKEISKSIIYSKGPETIIGDLSQIYDSFTDKKNVDVVFVIDTTGSMDNDMEKLKTDLLPSLTSSFSDAENVRIGLVLFRDYGDNYHFREIPVKVYGFTANFDSVVKNLQAVRIYGNEGGDLPEATYEALYAAANFFNWSEGVEHQVILITDAEPHPVPRKSGRYSKDYVMNFVEEKNIQINSILLPRE